MHSCIWASIPSSLSHQSPQPRLSFHSPRPVIHWSMALIVGPSLHSLTFSRLSNALHLPSLTVANVSIHTACCHGEPPQSSYVAAYRFLLRHSFHSHGLSSRGRSSKPHIRQHPFSIPGSVSPSCRGSLCTPGAFGHHLSACCR
jgi:hypothetical protein